MTLEQALHTAYENRPAIQAARSRLQQAEYSARALGAAPGALLDLGYSSSDYVGGTDEDLVLSLPVDLFGRTHANRRLGSAQVLRARAEFRQSLLAVQDEVLSGYQEAVAATRLAGVAHAQLEIAERLADATRKRVDTGVVPEVQITRVGIELERARQTSGLRDATQRAAVRRFAAILGQSPDTVRVDDFPEISDVSVEGMSTRRADLLLLQGQVAEAEAQSGVARTTNRPEFEVQGRRSPWNDGGGTFGLRLQLTFRLYDNGKVRNEREALSKQAAAARAQLADAANRATAEYDAARLEMNAAKAQVESYRRLATDTRELVRKSQVGFTEGATTLVEVLEAQRALREVEEGQVEAGERLLTAEAALLRASGVLLEEAK